MDGEAITIELQKKCPLPEDDERTVRFENIARSTKLRQGRGDIEMRGDADTLPFAMEVMQKGKQCK